MSITPLPTVAAPKGRAASRRCATSAAAAAVACAACTLLLGPSVRDAMAAPVSATAVPATTAATAGKAPVPRKAPHIRDCDSRRGATPKPRRSRPRCATKAKPASRAGSRRTATSSSFTFNLGGSTWQYLGYSNHPGWLFYQGGWTRSNTTTQIRYWQEIANDMAIGTQDDYYYWSTQGWILYRIRKCSSWNACSWTWVRPGY
jgi:hypothetical protein